jgi:hypothetical protein
MFCCWLRCYASTSRRRNCNGRLSVIEAILTGSFSIQLCSDLKFKLTESFALVVHASWRVEAALSYCPQTK